MPDSLKNLLTSVDWSRMASRSDVRNALVGSALGGALLGGASLTGDHDPEESKLAPVGDALTGALLGGIAGYGIPKGLELFRNSAPLAPANDQLPDSNYLGAAAKGGLLGAGTIGASIPGIYGYHALKMINAANDRTRVSEWSTANKRMIGALERRLQQDLAAGRTDSAAHVQRRLNYHTLKQLAWEAGQSRQGSDRYDTLVKGLKGVAGGSGDDAVRAQRLLKALKLTRRQRMLGFTSLRDLTQRVTDAASAAQRGGSRDIPPRLFRDLLLGEGKGLFSGKGKKYLQTIFSGKRYAPVAGLLSSRPWLRMLGRAGKWGAGGAALATALHALLGPSAKDNFKN